nr:phage protease [Spartinivicinus marinus]
MEAHEGGSIWGLVARNRDYSPVSISPVFTYDFGHILRLSSAGLTNQPNLHLKALNQR